METVLLFLFVFGVFFWVLRGMLRYTQDTVGENSPYVVERVYKTTHRSYWLNFESLFSVFFLLMSASFVYILSTRTFTSVYPLWTVYVLFSMIVAQLLWLAMVCLSICYSYWKGIGPVTLRYVPKPFTLYVSTRTREIVLRSDTVVRVVKTVGKRRTPASGMGYYCVELCNGEQLLLSTYTKGLWAFFDYFSDIPITYESRYFPILPTMGS